MFMGCIPADTLCKIGATLLSSCASVAKSATRSMPLLLIMIYQISGQCHSDTGAATAMP